MDQTYSLEVRDAAVAAISALPAWTDRTHAQRIIPTTEAQVPCVLVRMGDASYGLGRGDGTSGAYEFRVDDELIVSVVMATQDEALIDRHAAQVLYTVLTDYPLSMLLEGVRSIERTVEVPRTENLTLIEVRHTIRVQYSHRFEPVITDNLEGVDMRLPGEPDTNPRTGMRITFPEDEE